MSIALFLAGILARPASALCEADEPEFFPAGGSADVAISALPLIRYDVGSVMGPPALLTADGAPVAATLEERSEGGAIVVIFHPDEPLLPTTDYFLTVVMRSGTPVIAPFTTGEAGDKDAPALPTLVSADAYAYDPAREAECGVSLWVEGMPSAGVDLTLAGDADPWRVEVEGTADDGSIYLSTDADSSGGLASGGCSGEDNSILDSEGLTLRWRAVDASGNASAWSAPVAVALPWPAATECPKGGCATAPLLGGLSTALLGMLGALRRKR